MPRKKISLPREEPGSAQENAITNYSGGIPVPREPAVITGRNEPWIRAFLSNDSFIDAAGSAETRAVGAGVPWRKKETSRANPREK